MPGESGLDFLAEMQAYTALISLGADNPYGFPAPETLDRLAVWETDVFRTDLDGDLVIPAGSQGLVIFAHGSGSSRHSPRNRYVARLLNDAGLATLAARLEADFPRSNAARGLRTGDIITAVNGLAVDRDNPLDLQVLRFAPGDAVTLDVLRDGQNLTLEATLGTRPADLTS